MTAPARVLLWLVPALAPACSESPPSSRAAAPPPEPAPPVYETRAQHDPNGIGKFYMGREIAHVMGHEGADWLERPEREKEEDPARALDALDLKPGLVVADIGAGTGYFTFRMAPRVAPGGRVLAVDIQSEMLALLRKKAQTLDLTNVEPVLGTIADPKLPDAGVDLVLMVDVYHEFSEPWAMMRAIRKSLAPGGRVVLVEYRAEDPAVPIKAVHKMTEAQVKREMTTVGLTWVKTVETLPRQHILIFGK